MSLGTWAYTSDELAFKADLETSTLAESNENFSSVGGWNVLEYRGMGQSFFQIRCTCINGCCAYKEAGNSFQQFSNSYTLKDEYCHCLTSDATIMLSQKYPIIGKQVAIIYFT